jgi:hypothetical protein
MNKYFMVKPIMQKLIMDLKNKNEIIMAKIKNENIYA